MVSSVVVTDYASLAQNLSENAKFVLCQAAFGAGAYAIGGRLIGAAALTPPAALVTGGALLAALALCPSNASEDDVFGMPPGFTGGQCAVNYRVQSQHDSLSNPGFPGPDESIVLGPITEISVSTHVNPSGQTAWAIFYRNPQFPQGNKLTYPWPVSEYSFEFLRVVRQDGQPDNCGNAPVVGGQIVRNTEEGDTIDNSKVVNNENYTTVIPVLFNAGGINNTLNLSFGPIEIGSLFPLNFNIDVGGIGVNFKQKPDGTLEPDYTNPDKTLPNNKLEKILKDIQSCVCKSDVELDTLMLLTVGAEQPCEFNTETLLVPKGSVSSSQFQRFTTTSNLARESCERNSVQQLPEEVIYSATTTEDGRELFTGEIDVEVVSLLLKITSVSDAGPGVISLYPAANQRKFGSVSFVLKDLNGGGDYIYIFDEETYIPLPRRGKKGKLRILMKRGVSFSVYDSGERL